MFPWTWGWICESIQPHVLRITKKNEEWGLDKMESSCKSKLQRRSIEATRCIVPGLGAGFRTCRRILLLGRRRGRSRRRTFPGSRSWTHRPRRPPVAVSAVVGADAVGSTGIAARVSWPEAVPATSLLPLLASGCLPPASTRAAGAVLSVSGLTTVTAAATALVAGTPRSLSVVCGTLSALAAVHVVGCHLLQQVERHLGVHMLTRMRRIEGPAAADDSSRLLRVVTRPRDELQALDDGRRRQSLPQCRFVFVEASQYRREKIRVQ